MEAMRDQAESPQVDRARLDPADVQATLGSVASGLAEQLSSITEEMNKIRQELYGEQGIGGIAAELEKLKVSGLAGLVDGGAPESQRGDNGAASSARSASTPRTPSEARRRRNPDEREQELEDLRRRFRERRGAQEAQAKPAGVSFSEKLVMLFLVLVCLYIGSPFFRSSVKRAANSLIFGMPMEGDEEEAELEPDF